MSLLFSLQPDNLANLHPEQSVEFMRRLLWAEARRVGIGEHLVTVPDCINTPDGGVDATIEDADPTDNSLILPGLTGYQIKSSDLSPQKCREELYEQNRIGNPLKPEIKRILDAGGNYVLALFANLTPQQITNRVNALNEELGKHDVSPDRVRLLTPDKLAPMCERFPSLVSWIKEFHREPFIPYSVWANNRSVNEPRTFVADDMRERIIEDIHKNLRNSGAAAAIIRVNGLPGIGKTRLVFESLSPYDLRNQVIYAHADEFIQSGAHAAIINDNAISAIMVIDECDLDQHRRLVDAFSRRGPRLSLITMSYEYGNAPQPTLPIRIEQLDEEHIKRILNNEFQGLPNNTISRLADFADGYPRIAMLLGQSYQQELLNNPNPSDLSSFIKADDDDLFNRLIGGGIDTASASFRTTKKVLTGLSLFDKIGYASEELRKEAKWLSDYMGVEWNDFQDAVREQQERGLIRGTYHLYVTPFMLKQRLFAEHWQSRGFSDPNALLGFWAGIPDSLRYGLIERFISSVAYLREDYHGLKLVQDILGPTGPFDNEDLFKSTLGAKFFLALAQASPSAALTRLKATIGNWSKDDLLQFTTGRREVIYALERIAVWREHFPAAARLLLKLAVVENETWSNNASGVFAELFTLAPGPVAPTEAPPSERFPVLKEALYSESQTKRAIALSACDKMLGLHDWHRVTDVENQGFRIEPKLWEPKSKNEIIEAWEQVWKLLRDRIQTLSGREAEQATDKLLAHSRFLLQKESIADMVIRTIDDLLISRNDGLKKCAIRSLHTILELDSEKLSPSDLQRLESLRDRIDDMDYHSRMIRYVATHTGEEFYGTRLNERRQNQIDRLARESLAAPNSLQAELAWLMAPGASYGGNFGYTLAKIDNGFTMLNDLIEAQRGIKTGVDLWFLSAYMRYIAEKDLGKWEREIELLARSPDTQKWVAELTYRSGTPSEQSAERILKMARDGVIRHQDLHIFTYGGLINLPPNAVRAWVEFLLEKEEVGSVGVAANIFNFYFARHNSDAKPSAPSDLALSLLTNNVWFQQRERYSFDNLVIYAWREIANTLISRHPETSLILAKRMVETFGVAGSIMDNADDALWDLLDNIIEKFPIEAWDMISERLMGKLNIHAYSISRWLSGSFRSFTHQGNALSPLRHVPTERIWQWVDGDIEDRAWKIALVVPKDLFHSAERKCLARELLAMYGDREDVQSNFAANYGTGGFAGPESAYIMSVINSLNEFKKSEKNPNVLGWVEKYVESLRGYIKQAEIREEYEGF